MAHIVQTKHVRQGFSVAVGGFTAQARATLQDWTSIICRQIRALIGNYSQFATGLQFVRHNLAFTVLLLTVSAGAAFTAYSRANADQGGALASLLLITRISNTQAQATQAATTATSADQKVAQILDDSTAIRDAVTKELTPVETFAKLGYTPRRKMFN